MKTERFFISSQKLALMETFEELFPPTKKQTNYKKWAYKFIIYLFLLNILVAFMVVRGNYRPLAIIICAQLANLLLVAGTVLIILSVQNKEQKNYQYYVSIIGYPIFIILTCISLVDAYLF